MPDFETPVAFETPLIFEGETPAVAPPSPGTPAGPTTAQLLDLAPNVGVRAESYRFELLDAAHSKIGTLAPDASSPPTVSLDTTRTTSIRTLTNMTVPRADLSQINTETSRVRVSLLLSNGAILPCGVFMFGDDARNIETASIDWSPSLFDEMFIVDQPLEQSVSLRPGQSVLGLYRQLLDPINLPSVSIDVPDVLATNAVAWRAGGGRLATMRALATLLACYPPFFDNQGTHRLRPAALDAATAHVDHVYEWGGRIIRDTSKLVRDGWRIPNRYQVIGDNPKTAVSGIYDIPAIAPHSAANRGYVITDSRTVQGIASNAQAVQAAKTIALSDHRTYEQATFTSTPDPRHDSFDVVQFLGVRYLEQGWDLVCTPGGDHRHRLSRLWG